MDMARRYKSVLKALERWANNGVAWMLGLVVAVTSIAVGIAMVSVPNRFEETFSFQGAFQFASPYAWATAFIISALWVLIGVFTNPKTAMVPCFMLGATFAALGLLILPQIADGAVPFSAITCGGLAWTCIIAQIVCGFATRSKDEEQTPVDN